MKRINEMGAADEEDESMLDAPMIDASYMKASSKMPMSDASRSHHNPQHSQNMDTFEPTHPTLEEK